ncbi:MAG: tRNA uracil 4-sulfurtransferase ThiI [Patescibacteria group bacterium]|nr:tRNA uracil 4-sulfurtransferase ThiI [Patescibacteria group bacterium]
MKGYLIHYGEIGIKGENRPFFENKLVKNITKVTGNLGLKQKPIKKLYGRYFLETSKQASSKLEAKIETRLARTFGIANFSPALLVDRDIDKLKEVVWEEVKKRQPFKTFRIRASRVDKSYHLTSREIEFKVGGYAKEKSGAEVDLETGDVTCYIEILSKKALIYFEKLNGPGGLPVTTAGKVVTLLSGGIDSPVAAWQIAKRGAKNVFVHFHSYPQTNKASQEVVQALAKELTKWQLNSHLYMVPLLDIQKEIVAQCPKKLRVLLYRRMMIRLAEFITKNESAKALVTGESLGQVASQTLENIHAVNSVATLPILRPLIGMDKQDIVNKAKEIKTYEISIRPYQDCCSLFVPDYPETRAKTTELEKAESILNTKSLIKKALENTKKETFNYPN